jgi:hypothetical protein
MMCRHCTRLAQWLVASTFLLLPMACGPSESAGDAGNRSGSGSASGSMAGSGAGADASADVASSGATSGRDASGGAEGGGSGSTDGAVPDGGKTDAATFVCPPITMPGTCSPPADIRCPYPKLSQTGCMDPSNPLKMASFLVPYEVNSPLWSDGALKTRGMRIPTGTKIHVKDCTQNAAECCVMNPSTMTCLPPADDGKWVFPAGTVMVKNFMFPDASLPTGMKLVETRLFIHLDHVDPASMSDWVGYGYQWNEAQTEATITGGSDQNTDIRSTATFQVAADAGAATAVTWHYPSRGDCMHCHTAITPSGGSTLGLETAQMNRVAMGDTMNQIDKFQTMGLFEAPPAKPYKAALVAPYVGQAGAPPPGATLDQRARSYLHANCSFCHRPDGVYNAIDFRYDVPFHDTYVCNATPGKGDQGVVGALLLTPQSPMNSIMLLRMQAPPADDLTGNHGRMPEIATYVVDTSATTLISDWINSIAACP